MIAKPRVYIEDADTLTFQMFLYSEKFTPSILLGDKPDLVCFTGGADVQPLLYNEENVASHCSPMRDRHCQNLWDKWPDVPRVGICRGSQFLNVMSGGAMYQDVDAHGVDHQVTNLLPMPDTGFKMGTTLMVSSTHHQMMIAGDKGEVITIANRSTQFVSGKPRVKPEFDTEVVWYPETKSLCYQPHPEYARCPANKVYFFDLLKFFFGMGK